LAKTYNPGMQAFKSIQIFGFFISFNVNFATDIDIDI